MESEFFHLRGGSFVCHTVLLTLGYLRHRGGLGIIAAKLVEA